MYVFCNIFIFSEQIILVLINIFSYLFYKNLNNIILLFSNYNSSLYIYLVLNKESKKYA